MKSFIKVLGVFLSVSLVCVSAASAAGADYRMLWGLNPRKTVWFVAQLHLYLGAFVLAMPIFAVIIEYAGYKTGRKKYDLLAYEFAGLLSVAYAVTAALGGLLIFALIGFYPTFTGYMTDIFGESMLFYALLFFGETFFLYFYYYGWQRLDNLTPLPSFIKSAGRLIGIIGSVLSAGFLFGFFGKYPGAVQPFWFVFFLLASASFFLLKNRKGLHLWGGVWLNLFGTAIMMVANSWVSYMMSPTAYDPNSYKFTGTVMDAVINPLWIPLGIHRMFGNLAFGGFVAGAYAAVRFIGSDSDAQRAHYDWMGYVANFVGVCGLLPLPFAGYYLGREIYSNSALMGNNMMGGDFSWTFIMQAMLVGGLFLFSCYYLWTGMGRIPGAEKYRGYVKYLNAAVLISLAVWITPHNMPLTASEVAGMGGSQYHPLLKYLGLMPAKNAAVNLIIISTYAGFLLYIRSNRNERIPVSSHGKTARTVILAVMLFCLLLVGRYAVNLFTLDPASLDLPPDRAQVFITTATLLFINCGVIILATAFFFADRGKTAQFIYLGFTIFSVVFFLGPYGFMVMEKASPFLRNIAVSQFIQLLSCLVLVSTFEIFLFRSENEKPRWGKMPERSQYTLIALCVLITFNMGLMGFIRSGLRTDWHIYGLLRDTSEWAFTPSNYTMTVMVSAISLVFLLGLVLIFWLSDLNGKKELPPQDDIEEGI